VWQEFARGYFAFWPSGPWNLAEMDRRLPPDAKDRWSTAPFPAPDGAAWPGASLAGGASLVVARGARRADAAWRLVEWLSEPAQQARFWELSGDLPARRTPWHRTVLRSSPKAEAFWVQLQAVRPTPRIPEWERIAAAVGRWAERMIREDVTVDAGLESLDREVDQVLEKRRWLEERRN
jgi:multiple sugar transport system substrate-binding protein